MLEMAFWEMTWQTNPRGTKWRLVNEGTDANFQTCGISFLAWSGEILEIVLLQVAKSL
jgi:hypothetical protein